MIEKLNNRNISFICLGAAFLVIVLYVLLGLIPSVRRIKDLKLTVHKAQSNYKVLSFEEKLLQKNRSIEEFNELKQMFKSLKVLSEETREKLTKSKNTPLVILEIEDIATNSGIELNFIKPQEILSVGSYKAIPIEIGFEDRFVNIVEFLSRIEDASTLMIVKESKIEANKKNKELLNVRMKIFVLVGSIENIGKG